MVCCSFLLLHQACMMKKAHELHYKTIRSNLKLIKNCDMRPYHMILFGSFFFHYDVLTVIERMEYKTQKITEIEQIATQPHTFIQKK